MGLPGCLFSVRTSFEKCTPRDVSAGCSPSCRAWAATTSRTSTWTNTFWATVTPVRTTRSILSSHSDALLNLARSHGRPGRALQRLAVQERSQSEPQPLLLAHHQRVLDQEVQVGESRRISRPVPFLLHACTFVVRQERKSALSATWPTTCPASSTPSTRSRVDSTSSGWRSCRPTIVPARSCKWVLTSLGAPKYPVFRVFDLFSLPEGGGRPLKYASILKKKTGDFKIHWRKETIFALKNLCEWRMCFLTLPPEVPYIRKPCFALSSRKFLVPFPVKKILPLNFFLSLFTVECLLKSLSKRFTDSILWCDCSWKKCLKKKCWVEKKKSQPTSIEITYSRNL